MFIRTPADELERKRLPAGALRANREHPLYQHCRGLFVFAPNAPAADLMGFRTLGAFENSASIGSGPDGAGLLTNAANRSGISQTFASGDPLYITSGPGLSTFSRWSPTGVVTVNYPSLFELNYSGGSAPYNVQSLSRMSSAIAHVHVSYNSGGTQVPSGTIVGSVAVGLPMSHVISHAFASRVDYWAAGVSLWSNTTSVAAPTYGASPRLNFGQNGIDAVNSAACIHLAAVFAFPLDARWAAELEDDPYDLIEQQRSWVYYTAAGAPPSSGLFPFKRKSVDGGGMQNLGGMILR